MNLPVSIRSAICFGVCTAAMVAVVPTASAAPNLDNRTVSSAAVSNSHPVTSTMETHVREMWNKYGVSKTQQDSLLKEYSQTGKWDSLAPGAKPVSVQEQKADGEKVSVLKFKDGSILVEAVSDSAQAIANFKSASHGARGAILPQKLGSGIRNCSVSSNHWEYDATGCNAEFNWGLFSMNFKFSFTSNEGGSRFTQYYDPSYSMWTPGGSWSGQHFVKESTTDLRLVASANTWAGSSTYYDGVTISGVNANEYHN